MQELEQAIRERAYHLWTANGCQDGDAEAHWLTAQREILASSLGTLGNVSAPQTCRSGGPKSDALRRSRRGRHQRRCELHSGRRMLAVELGEAVAVSTQRRLFVPGCIGPLFRRISVTILSRSKNPRGETTWQ